MCVCGGSTGVAPAMSTWNNVAVSFWQQMCVASEQQYEIWRKSSVVERRAYEKQYLYDRRCPMPESGDAVEALLRIELLERIPGSLTKRAVIAGCTSSSNLVLMLQRSLPNEGEARFDLVEELDMLPEKLPVTTRQFAVWLEEDVTKLVAADEAGANVEPRKVTSILTCACWLETAETVADTCWTPDRSGRHSPTCSG